MPTQISDIVRHVRRAIVRLEEAELSDGQLLGRFLEQRDEAAVAALVRRHGQMVWGVCRRVLGNHHDAEDAFQATFLVLVRGAASIKQRTVVGHWLYGVAHRTALKARTTRARRRQRERSGSGMPEPPVSAPNLWSDLLPVLDQELSRLPDRYQTVIVLCDLKGKSGKEVARQLGLPYGTVTSRLTRGRAMLAQRLARQGLPMTAGALAIWASAGAASTNVPAAVVNHTVNILTSVNVRQATTAGLISARVAVLAEGVLKAMLMSKLKAGLGICLVLGILAIGGTCGYHTLAAGGATSTPPPDRLADMLILLDKQLWQATSSHDVSTFGKLIADDWTCQDPKWTRAFALEHYKHQRFVEVNVVGERNVYRIDKHTALMSYEVKWRAEGDREPRSSFGHNQTIHCWVERNGGWVIKHTETVSLLSAKESVPAPALVPFPGTIGPGPVSPRLVPGIGLLPERAGTPWKQGLRASGIWENQTPDQAFDGDRNTYWNSGGFAPAWIEKDLGAAMPLAGVVLVPLQDIPGPTIHEVWVSSEPIGTERSKARLVHTFAGSTTDRQRLQVDFPTDLSARYVQIRTTQSPAWIAWYEVEIQRRNSESVKPGTGKP
jgi:RNA polymerase sigma factor (sigma-70 family)